MNTTDEAPHQQVLTFCWAWFQHSWLWLPTHSWKIISVKPHLLPFLPSPISIHDCEPNGKRTIHNLSLMHDMCHSKFFHSFALFFQTTLLKWHIYLQNRRFPCPPDTGSCNSSIHWTWNIYRQKVSCENDYRWKNDTTFVNSKN